MFTKKMQNGKKIGVLERGWRGYQEREGSTKTLVFEQQRKDQEVVTCRGDVFRHRNSWAPVRRQPCT